MKILNTVAIISVVTMAIHAESPAVQPLPEKSKLTFDEKKAKRIEKIEDRINKIVKREDCFKNATNLTEMQSCRVDKLKNKPFKLKKGMTFEAKKAKKIAKMDKHIEKMKSKIVCMKNATNTSELKACHPKKQKHLKK